MILLHNIGARVNSNYNTLEEILGCDSPVSFDGIYSNVYLHRDQLRQLRHKPVLFIMGLFVGKDNSFDTGQPHETYCNWEQLFHLHMEYGFELAWHTWTHPNLTTLSDERVRQELRAPFPMKQIAYPYGNVDERVARLAKEAGYEVGWSVTQGDDSQFQRRRRYLNW